MKTHRPRLVVFSDDWGRHPSSCQHLVRELLDRYQVDWVNTIGTRRPSFEAGDLKRILEKAGQWTRGAAPREGTPPGLRVHAPLMWPGFKGRLERDLNLFLLRRALRRILPGPRPPAAVITTVPLVADLARRTAHLHWVYYCVDDLARWPGLDGQVLRRMEEELVPAVARVVVVSRTLEKHMAALGREAELLTHGVDLPAWRLPERPPRTGPPRFLYWGVIDARLDPAACLALAGVGELAMVGRPDGVPPELRGHPRIRLLDPVPMEELPGLAAGADVLVMPYADLPVTRAMQPLKLKECLATGLPVLAPPLPAIREWADALDLCGDPETYARLAATRCGNPLPPEQAEARKRLAAESWRAKSERFAELITEKHRTVLHVRIVTEQGGGPEKTILASPRFLENTSYRVLTAYLHNRNDPDFPALRARAEREGCPLIPVPDRHPFDPAVLHRLARICREERVRIWHGHDYKSNLLGLLLRRRLGLHLVTTVHGWIPGGRKMRLYHAIDRFCLRRYDRVIAVSDDLHRRCLGCGVPAARMVQVENGIDTDRFRRTRPAPEARGDATPPGRLVIGAVGRLAPEKGFHLLVGAVARLLEEGLDLELRIAGEGPARAELEEAVDAAGHLGRFTLLGHCEEVIPLYEGLDLFALSSLTEGLPNCLLEALAMEVPVLATRTGGVPALLDEGKAGLLCDPGSEEELTAGLRRLAGDAGLRAELAAAGRDRVVTRYSFAARMERMRGIYDELLGLPGGDSGDGMKP